MAAFVLPLKLVSVGRKSRVVVVAGGVKGMNKMVESGCVGGGREMN